MENSFYFEIHQENLARVANNLHKIQYSGGGGGDFQRPLIRLICHVENDNRYFFTFKKQEERSYNVAIVNNLHLIRRRMKASKVITRL